MDKEAMKNILKEFAGGFSHFVRNGIVPAVNNSVKLSANLRSEQDAYTSLASYQADVEDQLQNGIWKTKSVEKVVTKLTGETERRKITEVVLGDDGSPIRKDNILQSLGCIVTQCQINQPIFDPATEKAITMRKQQSLETEVAKQEAIRAEQDAKTAEAKAKAMVAKKRAEEEVAKVAAVVQAEKERDVAKLRQEAAGYEKKAKILEGQGIAEKKRLIMVADGALEKKLNTYEHVQGLWAKAFAEGYKVPTVNMGAGDANGTAQTAFHRAMDSQTLKNMKELGLDLNIKK
jgi:regulator of protease activity HflC (stomatin/prohibitin superfamily)